MHLTFDFSRRSQYSLVGGLINRAALHTKLVVGFFGVDALNIWYSPLNWTLVVGF